jgi:hypothetical protein
MLVKITKQSMVSNRVIVNVGAGFWYHKGTERLIRSLQETGYNGRIMASTILPEGSETHQQNPYAFKVKAIEEALDAGYTKIVWMDSSIYCVQDPNSIFDKLEKQGYYFVKNGYNVCEETNDFCLDWFGVSRDKAVSIPQIASGFWGLDFEKALSWKIFNKWKESCKEGCFKGSRSHDNQSEDPRFLWHRQDQSALSLSISKHKLNLDELGNILTYNYREPGNSNYVCNGM